jgi:hypothetical protein
MLDLGWLLGLPAAGLAVVIAILVRRGPRLRHQDGDAWASVRLTYAKQADGVFPVGVVRVQNPALVPAIVSASVRPARPVFGRWRHKRRFKARLSVRSPRVGRRPRLPEGMVLGAVAGGAARVWELPVGGLGRLPVVRVRVDQGGARAKVFAWTLDGSRVPSVVDAQDPRPALTE